jgi:hypothetical protein
MSVHKLGELVQSSKKVFPYKFASISNFDYIGPIPDEKYFNNNNEHTLFCKENSFFNFKIKALEYCFQDIMIVKEVLTNILNIINNYDPKIIKNSFSFSSISYKIFSKKYDTHKVCTIKNNIFEHEYFKNAYYGGRCEVFGNPLSNKIIHYFDFSGMYSQCMMEKFPIGKPSIVKNNLSVYNCGFHTIRFKCDDYLPFLPYRHKKLLFPIGEVTGTF